MAQRVAVAAMTHRIRETAEKGWLYQNLEAWQRGPAKLGLGLAVLPDWCRCLSGPVKLCLEDTGSASAAALSDSWTWCRHYQEADIF